MVLHPCTENTSSLHLDLLIGSLGLNLRIFSLLFLNLNYLPRPKPVENPRELIDISITANKRWQETVCDEIFFRSCLVTGDSRQ